MGPVLGWEGGRQRVPGRVLTVADRSRRLFFGLGSVKPPGWQSRERDCDLASPDKKTPAAITSARKRINLALGCSECSAHGPVATGSCGVSFFCQCALEPVTEGRASAKATPREGGSKPHTEAASSPSLGRIPAPFTTRRGSEPSVDVSSVRRQSSSRASSTKNRRRRESKVRWTLLFAFLGSAAAQG